jgi:hypothetical protein
MLKKKPSTLAVFLADTVWASGMLEISEFYGYVYKKYIKYLFIVA